MKRILKTILAVVGLFVVAINLMAASCSKASIEGNLYRGVRGVKAAREITTTQHQFGHITDEQYKARLLLFKSVYHDIDVLGDDLSAFAADADVKPNVLEGFRKLTLDIGALAASGDIGVKNSSSQAAFFKWTTTASVAFTAIQSVVQNSHKPVKASEAKALVEKAKSELSK